jgi:hypothetical protein
MPIQMAEVTARNAIFIPVSKRFGAGWYDNPKFQNILAERMRNELADVVKRQRKRRKANLTGNHIIADLSFGFWTRLMTAAYDKHLWANGVKNSFPNASRSEGREQIFVRLDRLRKFRNDVAHHYAVFDKGPSSEYQNALHLTKLACDETHWLTKELSSVSQVINNRPK